MGIVERDSKTGRAVADYRTDELYMLVRQVALEVKPGNPQSLSISEFDRARAATERDDPKKRRVPSARSICTRLVNKRDGKAMGWERIKEVALDDQASIEHVERRREASAPAAAYITDRAIYFALRFVAQRLDVKTLKPMDYEEERLVAIKEEEKRDPPRPLLRQLLPTGPQIQFHFTNDGDDAPWDQALAVAELEPRQPNLKAPGPLAESLPLDQAIHHYVEHNDELPSQQRFKEFVTLADIQTQTPSKPWAEHLDDAIAYRRTKGLHEPTEHPKPVGKGHRKPAVKAPSPGSIDGTQPRRRKGRRRYTREEVIAAIQAYLEQLDGGKPTQRGYGRFAVKNQLPAVSSLQRCGTWTELLEEAR